MSLDPLLSGNYNDVPETIPPLEVGIYDFRVETVSLEPPDDGKTDYQIVVKAVVQTEGPMKGRTQTRYFNVPPNTDLSEKANFKRTMVKRLFVAAGIQPEPNGGFDRNKLVGAVFCAEVRARTYQDSSGNTREARDLVVLRPDKSRFD